MPIFADFDRRGYTTVDVRTGYGEWAATYDHVVEDEMSAVRRYRGKTCPSQALAQRFRLPPEVQVQKFRTALHPPRDEEAASVRSPRDQKQLTQPWGAKNLRSLITQ